MLLYEAPGSPYAQKIKIALREKAVAFESELPESLGTGRTDGSFGGNPRAEVPLLVDGQVRIFDSSIILEYIEERWPDPPVSSWSRAVVGLRMNGEAEVERRTQNGERRTAKGERRTANEARRT